MFYFKNGINNDKIIYGGTMIYLDYSATTKADEKVIEKFIETEEKYFANPNSNHKLGKECKKEIDNALKTITDLLNIKENELIITSGASEANNTALKGLNVDHIITTKLEHSSVTTPVGYLQTKGVKVDFVNLDENGLVDISHLKSLITNDKTLVSIIAVNSETGIREPIEEIGKMLKEYPNVYFHSDVTQALGKVKIDLTDVDLASFSMHKIYGFRGIGGLIKKENIKITPLIHGGKSTTIYRSGTPQTGLITSSSVAIKEAFDSLGTHYEKVKELSDYLKENIRDIVTLNSNDYSIPHIVNFSIDGKNSEDTLLYFSDNDILISSKTACSSGTYSQVVNELYHDMNRAEESVRVSISYKTTKEEIDEFIEKLKEWV